MEIINNATNFTVRGVMINVGDGDAIMLTLQKNSETLLVVIDGGDKSYATDVCKKVRLKCIELQKTAPDLIICSHYDSDHIAGINRLVAHFKSEIKMIWVHRPPPVISQSFEPIQELREGRQKVSAEAEIIKGAILARHNAGEKGDLIKESVTQLNELLKLVDKHQIPTMEPFAEECEYSGWDEIKVLGPYRTYYQSLFEYKTIGQFFGSELSLLLEEKVRRRTISATPCEVLEKNPHTSETNRASVVIRVDTPKGRMLFTGDAGVESFKKLRGFPESIRNLMFLKVPHHGSKKNINSELISIMNPKIAYNSGNEYEDPNVISCLQKDINRKVRTTRLEGDLKFEF